MTVIPYLPENIRTPSKLVTAIRSRRGGKLLNLDRKSPICYRME